MRNIQSFDSSLICVVCALTRHPFFRTSYQYTVEFFIYFGSFHTSYFDKACYNNVDTGGLQICLSLITQHPWVVFGPYNSLIRYDYTCGV